MVATPVPTPTPTPVVGLAPRRGGTLRWVPHASMASIDPMWTTATVTVKDFGNLVYEGLFALDKNFVPQPMLLEAWEVSPDGLTWTFTLRSGLTFHNGDRVTAKDAVASIRRWMGRDAWGRSLLAITERFEPLDDRRFVLALRERNGLVMTMFSLPSGFRPVVMHEEVYRIPPERGADKAIGTGPFKFVSWEPGNRYILERFENYQSRREPPSLLAGARPAYLDRLVALEIPDHLTRVAALETGEVDFLDQFSVDLAGRVRAHPDLVLIHVRPGPKMVIVPNHVRPPFNDLRARKALQLAYPVRRAMVAAQGRPEFYQVCPSSFACGTVWELPGRTGSEGLFDVRDTARARALIREAGLEGTPVRLMVPEDIRHHAAASLVTREVLEGLGFRVEYQSMDWATVVARRVRPELWEVFHTEWVTWHWVHPLANPAHAKGGWFNQYQDETGRMEAARLALSRALTLEEQVARAADLARVIWEDVPYITLGEQLPVMAHHRRVKGYEPSLFLTFWTVWLEGR